MSLNAVSFRQYELDFDGFSLELGASFKRFGFAVLSDLSLDQGLVDRATQAAKAFFALPEAVKARYQIAGGGGQRGFTPFGVETAKGAEHFDLKEFWHVGRVLPHAHPYRAVMGDNVWPAEVPDFRPCLIHLYGALEDLALKVLRAIAHFLSLSPSFFEGPTHLGNSVLRLLHYPPAAFDGPHVRAGAHEDINTITLLLGAEEAGLQIKDRTLGWIDVNPPAGSVVCNVGDMLQRLTNDVLPSTTHRVVNPSAERNGAARYSTPFFLHFAPDFLIKTLTNCVTAERPDRYPTPITAQAYLDERLREIKLA